jgi:hypothetical protein
LPLLGIELWPSSPSLYRLNYPGSYWLYFMLVSCLAYSYSEHNIYLLLQSAIPEIDQYMAIYTFDAGFPLGLFFGLEDGEDIFPRNVG